MIRGELDLQVKLINDGVVNADASGKEIRLTTEPKYGTDDGVFEATGGILVVNASTFDGFHDNPTWIVSAGRIEVNTSPDYYSNLGASLVEISGTGVFDINTELLIGDFSIADDGRIEASADFSAGSCN